MKSLFLNNVRIQKFDENILRIEYSKEKKFIDEDTFLINNKSQFKKDYELEYSENNLDYIIPFKGYEVHIAKDFKLLNGVSVYKKDKLIYKYKRMVNTGELPPLDKTPLIYPIIDKPQILIPEKGYSYLNKKDNGFIINKKANDLYLIFAEKDHKLLRKEYIELTGRPNMVRLKALGSWNSKYYAYKQEEAEQVILDYEAHNMPLDNIVIDTDWRARSDRGIGYDINTKLFPDMKGYFDFAHRKKVEVMFNDHPEPQEGAKHCFSPIEVKYREEKLQYLLDLGLDYWWYDRNWSTKLISMDEAIHPETFGQYLFHDITRNYYEKSKVGKYARREAAMSNIDNVYNGKYYEINNTASHRFPFQWTGDITSNSGSLMENIYDIVRANNSEIVYANPDCGGHIGNPDKELFLNWMKIGSFLPILRPHCTNYVTRTREPWQYDEETVDICRNYFSLRYRLMEIIYKDAHKAYEDGTPLVKSLLWDYQDDKKCKKYYGEYFFAGLLVGYPDYSSAVFDQNILVGEKDYVGKIHCRYYNGKNLQGEPILEKDYSIINFVLDKTQVEKEVPMYDFSACFEGKIKFEKDTRLFVESDDGVRIYIDGKLFYEDWTDHSASKVDIGLVQEGIHNFKVEYYQGGGEAALRFYKNSGLDKKKNTIYLPEGEWLNPFSVKIISGNKVIKYQSSYDKLPLYIKLGTLFPLLEEKNHTDDLDFSKMTLDYYPSTSNFIEDEIYEDDGYTVAYKEGIFRKNKYKTYYDEKEKAFIIDLQKKEGEYDPYQVRSYMLKFHLLNRYEVEDVIVDEEKVPFKVNRRNTKLFVLNYGPSSKTDKTVTAKFNLDLNENHHIKIHIK